MTNNKYTTDTSPEASRIRLDLIRQQSPARRLKSTIQMSARVCQQCKAAIRLRHPDFSEDDVRIKFIEINYGRELAEKVRHWHKSRISI